MDNINAIINGNLQPWQPKTLYSDDYYAPALRELKMTDEDFAPHYKIDFGVVPFSIKIKYYQKLIDIDITYFINKLIDETTNATPNIIAFKIHKAQQEIKKLLLDIDDSIGNKGYDIALIASKHADFKTDRNHKECTFIFNYMLVSLIRCFLEIQSFFIESIHADEVFSLEAIYSQILQRATPENFPVKEIQTIETKPSTKRISQPIEKQESFAVQYAQEKYTVFMDVVNPYRFTELPKLKVLEETAINSLIKVLVENPLHYSIAMLSFLGYMESLKKTYSLTKEKTYSHIAKALKADARTVKGNCLVLNPNSNDDRYKYKADQYIVIVEQDYNKLLTGKLIN